MSDAVGLLLVDRKPIYRYSAQIPSAAPLLPSYDHPGFMLRITASDPAKDPTDYVRTENFETGELAVRWRNTHGPWERKLFVSRPDNVVVMSIAGPEGQVGCELSMEIKHALVQMKIEAVDGWLSAHAVYVNGKGGYDLTEQ